jgi:hypothetical protein
VGLVVSELPAATVQPVTRLTTWLNRHIILIGVVGGATVAIVGAATFAGLVAATWLGTPAGVALAATVAGAATTRAALAWSHLTVVEEDQ